MKNYNFNKTRVHLRFIVEPEQLTLPENQGSPPVYREDYNPDRTSFSNIFFK
jgi:hypothetical protein